MSLFGHRLSSMMARPVRNRQVSPRTLGGSRSAAPPPAPRPRAATAASASHDSRAIRRGQCCCQLAPPAADPSPRGSRRPCACSARLASRPRQQLSPLLRRALLLRFALASGLQAALAPIRCVRRISAARRGSRYGDPPQRHTGQTSDRRVSSFGPTPSGCTTPLKRYSRSDGPTRSENVWSLRRIRSSWRLTAVSDPSILSNTRTRLSGSPTTTPTRAPSAHYFNY